MDSGSPKALYGKNVTSRQLYALPWDLPYSEASAKTTSGQFTLSML